MLFPTLSLHHIQELTHNRATQRHLSDTFPRGRAQGHERDEAEEAEKEEAKKETRRRPSWRWKFACRSDGAWAGG